jgi:hypothetical protein
MIYVVSTIKTVGKSFTGIFIHDSQLKMESGIEIINFLNGVYLVGTLRPYNESTFF